MSLFLTKVPEWVTKVYHRRIWKINTQEKVIYLTFDDGPDPVSTPFILETLSQFSAKVTFFHLGSKIKLYPELFEACKQHGHGIGNHGYNHIDGIVSAPHTYVENINLGKSLTNSDLFRPPYGRLPLLGKNRIQKSNSVIMWDVMPGDFLDFLSSDEVFQRIIKATSNGSIIVLHENEKSHDTVKKILNPILSYFSERGYKFRSLNEVVNDG